MFSIAVMYFLLVWSNKRQLVTKYLLSGSGAKFDTDLKLHSLQFLADLACEYTSKKL